MVRPFRPAFALREIARVLSDGYDFGSFAIGRFDRGEIFAAAADDDDAPASQIGGLFGLGRRGCSLTQSQRLDGLANDVMVGNQG
jgi:hypothetical protein